MGAETMKIRNTHKLKRDIFLGDGKTLKFDEVAEVSKSLGERIVDSGNGKQIFTRKRKKKADTNEAEPKHEPAEAE